MQIKIENFNQNLLNTLRRAGYVFQRQEGDEMSFVRALATQGYPRFHRYAKVEGGNLLVNIHLDMKKETYGDNTRHHGEYGDEGALKEEVKRLRMILE